jgi:hypothetical protein
VLYALGDQPLTFQLAPPQYCLQNKLRKVRMRFPDDHPKVNAILFRERFTLEPPGPGSAPKPAPKRKHSPAGL